MLPDGVSRWKAWPPQTATLTRGRLARLCGHQACPDAGGCRTRILWKVWWWGCYNDQRAVEGLVVRTLQRSVSSISYLESALLGTRDHDTEDDPPSSRVLTYSYSLRIRIAIVIHCLLPAVSLVKRILTKGFKLSTAVKIYFTNIRVFCNKTRTSVW